MKETCNRPDKSQICNDNLKNYFFNSTLHGLRYVGETTISLFERCFFMGSFCFVLALSLYYISNIYEKWIASPVIISLNAVSTQINEIPFPAVTICNMNQARESVVSKFEPGTVEDMLLQGLCNKPVNFTGTRSESTNWTRFRKFLIEVSQPCQSILVVCKFGSVTRRCMEYFSTVLTDEGLCCIFNRPHPKYLIQNYDPRENFDIDSDIGRNQVVDWTPEIGYQPDAPRTGIIPRRASGAGSNMGLTVLLNINVNDYHCSTTNSAGFKVLLHNPTETPKMSDYGFSITSGQETRVVVTPKLAVASNLIRKVPIHQRQCVFTNEGNLTYFRTYSRKNCEMECESRILIEVCGCVLYYMPRVDENTTICNRDDWTCYERIQLAIETATNDTFQCNCLPGCFEISYYADVSSARLGTEGFLLKQRLIRVTNSSYVKANFASMHVYFEESFFRSQTKDEFIGFTEFLSNTGGLLGLFMGFSVVSIIELLYFLSIRPYCATRRAYKQMMDKPAVAPAKLSNRQKNESPIDNVIYPYVE